jgi:hypothetical protein
MIRTGFIVLVLAMISGCGNKGSKQESGDNGYSFEKLSARFKSITPPYQLSDTGFLKNKDTGTLRFREFESFIPDSIRQKIFGKSTAIRYVPLVQMKPSEQTALYLVKAMSGNKKAALLIAFQDGEPQAVLPFLVPDNDPTTSQLSSIDKSYVITKHISQQKASVPLREGREVYEYDDASKLFSFILHNPLNIENAEVVNPIDTFPRKHKYAGDYAKDKKNFVSIRDGRHPNQLQVFMHLEKNKGACTGEIKGELLITSPTTAIYRQGGDPCVLSFRFSGSSLTVREDEGCGAHRGLDCVFDGTYPKKKESKPKPSAKKKSR